MQKILIFLFLLVNLGCAKDNYYINNGKKEFLTPIKSPTRNMDKDYYKNSKGIVIGIDNTLIVKFKHLKNFNEYIEKFNIIKNKKIANNTFVFTLEDKSLTIDISNKLSAYDDIEYAQPNYEQRHILR